MKQSAYEILSRNTVVATWEDHTLSVCVEALLPEFLKRCANLSLWLETRAVDSHRANSRLLKKALRLQERDDLSTVLSANGVSITDSYWVRAKGSHLCYEDVRFDDSYFLKIAANLALYGRSSSMNYIAGHPFQPTPELTNTGSFEKCWRMEDGTWWMYKAATSKEAFSELFVCALCRQLHIAVADYEKVPHKNLVKTADFTHHASVNFEPAFSFVGEDETYEHVLGAIQRLCPDAVPAYLHMIFIDTLVMNPDRHTANFGLLRDVETGHYLGFSPLFDHNMALISRGYPTSTTVSKNDLMIDLFVEILRAHPEYQSVLPTLKQEDVEMALQQVNMKVRTKFVLEYIMNRYAAMLDRLQ